MNIRCIFYLPNETCPCQVMRETGLQVVPDGIAAALAERYCDSGRFIACPIFQRLEDTLYEAHQKLEQFAKPRRQVHTRAA